MASTSRLPRPPSSPAGPDCASSQTKNLKRKAQEDDLEKEARDQPRKLPAIGTALSTRPKQPLRSAVAPSKPLSRPGARMIKPQPLTKPRAPVLSRSTRGTSAPPTSVAARVPISRTVSGSSKQTATARGIKPAVSEDKRFAQLDTKIVDLQTQMSQELSAAKTAEIASRQELDMRGQELREAKERWRNELDELEGKLRRSEREAKRNAEDYRLTIEDLERERKSVSALKSAMAEQSTLYMTVETQVGVLQAKLGATQTENDELKLKLEQREIEVERLQAEVLDGECVRRRLHNTVQELKGNIRVFCRVRPVLPSDFSHANDEAEPAPEPTEEEMAAAQANIAFPDFDHKEIVLSSSGESATGVERKESWNFGFDRVFDPSATQAEVFEEVSQLAHSCTDGYNVCIFAYGQTGSGKSWTMEGGESEDTCGMIPRAVAQVFRVAEELASKGWTYTMEGQFLEIYNETINDLLATGEFSTKHEIKHDLKTNTTRVTDLVVLPLSTPSQVRNLLLRAHARRSVAATLMNEHSSRSHSVFTLRIAGANASSGERCSGSLNLVDLAGSERLNSSGVASNADRLKETVSINKSLSALADVIAALGEKGAADKGHVPYRNSKLTYLLQNSLGGNSKTLMVLNLSPLAAHLHESLTSLRFATKVNNTTIGTAIAKKQAKAPIF